MKELSIEEKAKAYDKALERAKIWKDKSGMPKDKQGILDDIFPELREYEDEYIRKRIIHALHGDVLDMEETTKAIAWLEKQGKQNYKIIKGKNYFCVKTHNYAGVEWIKGTKYYASDNYTLVNQGCECYCPEYSKEEHNNLFEEVKCDGCVEKQGEQKHTPKHKVGDTIYYNSFGEVKSMIVTNVVTDSTDNPMYEDENGSAVFEEDLIEQKPALIIPKFRVGDEIKTTNEAPLTITKITDSGYWSEDLFICSFENSAKWELVGKLVDKVEPKFHEGEWITNGDYTWKIVEVKPLDYILQSQDGNIVDDTISHVDEQFHSFTIEDAKDGDVLTCYSCIKGQPIEQTGIIKQYVGRHGGCSNCFEAYIGVDWDGNIITDGYMGSSNIYPATKEQRDTLERAITNAGYRWDRENLKLEKI